MNLKKDNTPDSNIRYYGSNPNNYVRFNNKLWRIIGVFGDNVKLVRKDALGELSWDSSEESVNNGYGINQWGESTYTDGTPYEGSDLMQYLNKMYYKGETVTYYNGSNNTTTCPTGSLNDDAKSMIENYTWNTGAIEKATVTDTLLFYNAERIYQDKKCSSGNHCTDTVNRTTLWTGYVALPYITDWAYASSEIICEVNMQKQDDTNNFICKNSNWMNGNLSSISSKILSGDNTYVYFINFRSEIFYTSAPFTISVFPTIYLKSNILITDGNGSQSYPYILSL